MKRIAAHIGLTFFCALAVAFYLDEPAKLVLVFAALAGTVILICVRKSRKTALPVIAATIAVAVGVNLVYTALAVRPVVERYCGESRRIKATLTDEAYQQYAKYYYPLRTESIDTEDASVKILLKTDYPLDIEPYDAISFTADMTPTVNNYYLAKGYYVTVNAMDIRYSSAEGSSRPLYFHVIRLRQAMREALEAYLPKSEANLAKAVLIGDKYALDQSVRDDFRYSGVSYYIVVSGMHFSILCMLSFVLFKRLFRKRWIIFPLMTLVILLYMMVTGFQPSVMRSGVMMLILITGRWIRRQSDPLTSLGVAGLAMPLIFSPYGCGDIGMILSFASTFSIIMWHTPIYERIRIKKDGRNRLTRLMLLCVNGILSIAAVCFAANILVFPLSVFIFNGFSVMTLLSSLLLYPLIWLTMALSASVCLLYYLGPLRYLALLLSWPLYGVTKAALWLVRLISSLPFAYVYIKQIYFYIWAAVTLALGFTAYFLRKRYRLAPYAAILSAIIFFGGLTVNTVVQLHTDVLEYDAGKTGSVIWLNRHGRIHMLRFDCNSEKAYATLHQLIDHYGGVQTEVCTTYQERVNYNRMTEREFPVINYLVYHRVSDVYLENTIDAEFGGSSVFILDEEVVLHTAEADGKMLLYLTYGEKSVMLIPSDYPYKSIPEGMRSADIIALNRGGDGYDGLTCDTLILCGKTTDLPLPQYDIRYDPSDRSVSIDMN